MLGWWSGYWVSEDLGAAFDPVTLGCDAFFVVQTNVVRKCGSQDGFSSGERLVSPRCMLPQSY